MLKTDSHRVVETRDRFVFLAVAVFVCLAAGVLTILLWIGIPTGWMPSPAPLTPTPAPTNAPTPIPSSQQVAILLLVVDDRTAAQPWLEGCWVLTFKPGTDQYYLLGFPVDAPLTQQYTLRDYFNANPRLEDRSRFVEEALNKASAGGLTINYYLYLDKAVLADFVDFLGGIPGYSNGTRLTGAELRAQYEALAPNARQRIEFQQQTLEAIVTTIQRQAWAPDLLRRLAERFAGLSLDADELLDLALAAGPLDQASFTVQIVEPPR